MYDLPLDLRRAFRKSARYPASGRVLGESWEVYSTDVDKYTWELESVKQWSDTRLYGILTSIFFSLMNVWLGELMRDIAC